MDKVFVENPKLSPYWWERTPLSKVPVDPLPDKVDVLVVGSGYTGLHAAIELARGGRDVLVCDSENIGHGCSTRNGGQISTSVKPSFESLAKRHGETIARQIFADGRQSLKWTEDFIRQEGIECDFRRVGRFHVAHNDRAFAELVASLQKQPEGLEVPAHVVSRSEQRSELGSDIYHGGIILENHAALDPGRYHAGLVALAQKAGVNFAPFCPVQGYEKTAGVFSVTTGRGLVQASDIVLATNGYSTSLSAWHRRRVIPIGSYIIATEELPQALVDELIPKDRIVSDTRRVLYYFRASPDRSRILFGGRVSLAETDPRASAPLLYNEMIRIFPQLSGYRVSHSWMGYVGYTFDTLAHIGSNNGVHYAMGYCGSGVGMAGYLGMRTGRQILGREDGDRGYRATQFPARPYYFGKPWFLAPAVHLYRLRDRLGL